jgi:hypothetical protein
MLARDGDGQAHQQVAHRADHAHYPAIVRHLPTAIAAGLCALLLAAGCSGNHPGPSTSPSGPGRTTPAATTRASVSASPGQQRLIPLPAAPSTTGQLRVLVHDAFPVSSTLFLAAIGAEAPDGSVFVAFAQQSDAPAAPRGSVIYVVDGDNPPVVAEHAAIPVTALAGDDTYLYVGGDDQIIEYDRSTGAAARSWNVGQPVRLMAVSGGTLWAVLGSLAGSGSVVKIDPGASGVTTVGTDTADVTSIAAGPTGLYYVEAGGATIVHVSPDGTRDEAATHQTINQQLSGPGAVQAISVIGNDLLLVTDAGQGLDSVSRTYNAVTLAGPLATAPGTAGSNRAIDSLAGPVDRVSPGSLACSGTGCVGRYNLATGAVTDAVTYPQSTELGLLLGPYPAVFVFAPSGPVYLDRIG